MDIIYLQDPRLLRWANERLGARYEEGSCRWVAGLANGSVVFVVVYSRFSLRNCELTIVTDGTKRWATRRSLREIFRTPFKVWSFRRVTFVVRADNLASLDMLDRLGAVREGCVRKTFEGEVDGIIFGMLEEECRWL